MAIEIRFPCLALPGLLLLLTLPAAGQIQVGDNLNLNLNGIMTGGYDAVYGNQINSSHGLNFGGNGTLSGSYYNPNFLSFNFSPYYDQSQQNSEFRSLFNGGGFNASTNIFGGSHFPGSFSYTRSWNSQGTFSMPGLPNYTTDSNSRGLNLSWSELLPDWPSLMASFADGNSDYTVLGSNQDGKNSFRNFLLQSGYRIAGFDLTAGYNLGSSHADVPLVSGNQTVQQIDSDYNTFLVSATHPLPMNGSFASSFNRSDINSDYMGSNYQGVVDTVNVGVGVNPKQRWNAAFNLGYTDSLTGSLFQNLVAGGQSGAGANIYQSQQSSNSLYLTGTTSYGLTNGLRFEAEVQRRQQQYLGISYGANTVGGGVVYTTRALGGFLSASVMAFDNTTDNNPGNSLSFTTNVAFNRSVHLWLVSADFSYAQNVQTYLLTYMNSFYNYSGNVRRRFLDGRLVWSATAAGSQSALNNQPNTGNSSQSYSTSVGLRRITASASYAKSNGYGLLGIGVPPPPGPIPADWLMLYDGTSEGLSLGATPTRKLSIGASFSKASSNTSTAGVGSWNHTEQVNAILNYRVRKLMFTAGYGRILQGFSASGVPPGNVSSYYMGFSRSFNFF